MSFTIKYYEDEVFIRETKRIRTRYAAEKIGESWFNRNPAKRKVLIEKTDGTFKIAITKVK